MKLFFKNTGNSLETNTAEVLKNSQGPVIHFKRLKGGSNVSISETRDEITISFSKILSGSIASDINNLNADVTNISSSVATDINTIESNQTNVSSSIATDINTIESNQTNVSSSIATDINTRAPLLTFTSVVTGNYLAPVDEITLVDLANRTVNPITITLPSGSSKNNKVGVKIKSIVSGSYVRITGSVAGFSIDGLDGVDLISNYEYASFQYSSSGDWYRVG